MKEWYEAEFATIGEAITTAQRQAPAASVPFVVVARLERGVVAFDVMLDAAYRELQPKLGDQLGLLATIDPDGSVALAESLTPLALAS